jgi:hypothetical protein
MSKPYILEATWSGYRTGQSKVCHRERITEKQAERYNQIVGILFTDGTHLSVSVRQAAPREKILEILSYSKILHTAAAKGLEGFLDVTEIR